MATRLKTVEYSFPALASLTNNTLTNLTQITVYLPETGTKTFRSVVAKVSMDDIITATGGTITTKTLALRLGAAGYTTVTNSNTYTNSGENLSLHIQQDFTSHFTTNWTGTSMTCAFQLQINQSTGTTLGMVNVCVTLEITYEYDDTSTTQVKTVHIPLAMPVGTLATSATTYDTIPVLDTYLPEASKTYRKIHVVVQGNEQRTGATTDHTLTLRVGSASVTTGNYEAALASDRFIRYVWDVTSAYPSTGATQTWQPTTSVTSRMHDAQAYLVVTYEFDSSSTTTVMNSLMIPAVFQVAAGVTTSSDYQRIMTELWIEEPATITTNRLALYLFFSTSGDASGKNLRIGTGSFTSHTASASNTFAGSQCMMERNDSAFTLVRGKNVLTADMYATDSSDLMYDPSGFWIINYTSGKATDGVGAHNHTVKYGLKQVGTAGVAIVETTSAIAPVIPESEFFLNAVGAEIIATINSTLQLNKAALQVELLSGEGGQQWLQAFDNGHNADPETGGYPTYGVFTELFKQFTGDLRAGRVDLETARRWRTVLGNSSNSATGWGALSLWMTYHTVTFDVAGAVTNSGGGTVNLDLHRADTGERVKETSRSGNGSYSMTWYDDTVSVFVQATEDATHLGRSSDGVAV